MYAFKKFLKHTYFNFIVYNFVEGEVWYFWYLETFFLYYYIAISIHMILLCDTSLYPF